MMMIWRTVEAPVQVAHAEIATSTPSIARSKKVNPVVVKSATALIDVPALITLYSQRYGMNTELALAIAKCESGYRTNVYGDGGRAYGVYQFHQPTFEMFKKLYGDESMDYKDPEDQIRLAILAIMQGEGKHWTCWRWHVAEHS